ncbi:MAG: penicillin-binding protein 2, partial [Candidatus Eisenbacteria bacterium]|nr:penicillin-binding protein 2 [Candidatus Eisenbacteria bacterium]
MLFGERSVERVRRERALAILVVALIVLFALRLIHLQVVSGPRYADLARRNLLRPDPIRALRGCIYDRHGTLLAGNLVGLGLRLEAGHPAYAQPEPLRAAVGEIAAALGVDPEPLVEKALRSRRRFEPVVLADNLESHQIAPLIERIEPIPGLDVERQPRRWYPLGTLGAHVLGHVGEVSEEELAGSRQPPYRPGGRAGRAGVEAQYEWLLRGIDGETYVTVDAFGRKTDLFPGVPPVPALPGLDLTLTLDARVQAVAESLLTQMVPAGGGGLEPMRGSIVVLDPWSGEILACASAPGFDPNSFAAGLSGAEWAALQGPTRPLLNRALQAAYPPASVFKIISSLAGLESGRLQPATTYRGCSGSYRAGNRSFGCWRHEGHGVLDLRGAFATSCDVYYYQLGQQLGVARLLDFTDRMRLGRRTGVDLPDERRGLVPSMAWYRERLGHDPTEGYALNLAIGQGELMLTPLAFASCVGGLVTDGRVRRPHVARSAVGRQGRQLIEPGEGEVLWELPVTAGHRRTLMEMLEAVVADDNGTGKSARIEGVRVGGKTGTAQNPHGRDHALFVG